VNPILQAIDEGYSAEDVIKYIAKVMPTLVPKVQKAVSNGYSLKEIVGFLAKSSSNQDISGLSTSQIHARNRQVDSKLAQKGLMAAGALAASPIAASAVRSAFSRALPRQIVQGAIHQNGGVDIPVGLSQSQQPIFPQGQEIQSINQTQKPPLQSSSASQPPVNAPNIQQQQQQIQPEVKTINVNELLSKSGLKKHVDELSKRTKDPKQIAALLYNRFPAEMKEFQAKAGKNMEDALQDYLGENPVSDNLKATEEKTTTEQQPKIEKSSIVASPNGIGQIRSIRNGEALIDIGGKLHKAKEEELIQSPLPEKDLADLYNDVISGIEKESGQQVSRNVYWAGYDPNTNELAYLPHDGGLYIYDDISPNDAKELTNLLSQRKSTGQNYIGAWTKGSSSPIGAQMYQLIQRLQKERGGKGSEYANKFMKVYDALELAKSAAKKQYEERKKKAKKPGID
jgi:hypothetical protein